MGSGRRTGIVAIKCSLFLLFKTILAIAGVVFASSIAVTPVVYHAEVGAAFSVTTNLVSADKGFSRVGSSAAAAGTSCLLPVNFGVSPGIANTALTPGDSLYEVQLNTTGSTPNATCFTVNLVLTPTGGSPTTYTVFIATLIAVSGQTIDCKFDIGTSIPSSLFSFKVTV